MIPILYCKMNMDNHWAREFQGELYTFYVDHIDDNKPITFSEFKSKVKLTEAFNNGNCVNCVGDDHLPDSIYRKLFFIGEQSQTDGLQFPEEAMQMFTTGIDITLAVDFNRTYVPKELTPEMDLKPLFANLNKQFSFAMFLFGNDQLAMRVSVSSLEREIHSGYVEEGLGSKIGASHITLYFNARIRPVTCPVIRSVKEVEEARMGTEGFFRYCLYKDSPRYVLQVLYSLIFHRKDYKVIKWFDKGYLIFTMERFQRDPNGCLKDAIASVIESIGNAFVPTDKNSKIGEETIAHYYERAANSFLPIIMGMVDMMQFKGMTPYHYLMNGDTKSRAVSRPLITGEAQDLKIEVKFADSNKRDPLNKKQAEFYLAQLETIKQNIAPLIEVIDRTISVLAPFVKDTKYHGDMLSFVSQKLAEDVLINPADYVGRQMEGAITQDGLDCIGEYATKVISG